MRIVQVQREEIRARLVERGMALFDVQGFNATTVEQITAAAGVAKGTFYNYFPSKEDLALAAFEAVVGKVRDRMLPTMTKKSSLKATFSELYDTFGRYTSPRPELIWIWCLENVKRGYTEPSAVDLRSLLEELIARGKAMGEIPGHYSQSEIALDLLGLMTAQVVDWYQRGASVDLAQPLIESVDRYFQGIERPGVGLKGNPCPPG